MPNTNKQIKTQQFKNYSFHQLVENLKKCNENRSKEQYFSTENNSESIRFSVSADTVFPTQDICHLSQESNGNYKLQIKFLGLQGSQSPLPGYYLDDLSWDERQGFNELNDFLNIFNHRMISQFHESWMKYRYYMNFKSGGTDDFSQRIFSLVGLNSSISQVKIPIEQTKLLAYAGLLANPGRSPSVIASLVSHGFNFDLSNVTVTNWLIRYVEIPEEQKNRLGNTNHINSISLKSARSQEPTQVGINFILGSIIKDRGSKFLLSIKELKLERFLNFLPNGSEYRNLLVFLSFILREPLCWDVELGLSNDQAQCLKLNDPIHSQLGWTTYLGQPEYKPSIILPMQN